MTASSDPTPVWPDPARPAEPPALPPPPEYSVGAASVPPPSPFSAPDPGYGAPLRPEAPAYYQGTTAAPVPGYSGYGGYGGYGAQPSYYPGAYAPVVKANGLAIASMVVSIIGAVFLFCYGVGGLIGAVGAVLGHVSRRQIRDRQESGDGMALAGIITGWIATALGLLIIAFFVIFIVMAINSYDPTVGQFEQALI